MQQMVTPAEALAIVGEHVSSLPVETVAHGAALGRTLARDVVSDVELPPFANSAMDGYAVIAADTASATATSPVRLRVFETIAAGAMPTRTVVSGACAKIMTGAALPAGADAVVMREGTQADGADAVAVLEAAQPREHVRPAGHDIGRGETVLRAGTVLRAAEWGMLASLNQAAVAVRRQPRVAVITTGEELVQVGAVLRDGQIRDSNSFTIAGLALASGAVVVGPQRVGDDPEDLKLLLQNSINECDAIVTSGGVSVGDFDPVRDVLRAIANVHFWKIAMKPGKPVMFATMPNSDGHEVPIFGLPGNPVSVMVAFEQFVRPALLRMQGRRAVQRVTLTATLDAALSSPAGKVEYVRARVSRDGSGWRANLTGEQSSGRLSTMTRANALLVVPAEVTDLAAGATVIAQMTDWPEME